MKELICIVCPNGCRLELEERGSEWIVRGNQCPRGKKFAIEEMTHPMRTVCTTVRTIFPEVPVVPVRVSKEIPKERIFDVMRAINQVTLTRPLKRGEAVIGDVSGLGADVIVTSNILMETGLGKKAGHERQMPGNYADFAF